MTARYKVVSVQWDDPPSVKQLKKRERVKEENNGRQCEVDAAERQHRLKKERESWELQKREWEIRLNRLVIGSVGEVILLVMSVLFAICALTLFVIAIGGGGVYAVGGSGLTGFVAICGTINLMLKTVSAPWGGQ
jgi:hypothetical protein